MINPIAGMGGSVGLKGTDGIEVLKEAVSRGALPLAAGRTARTLGVLSHAANRTNAMRFLAGPGELGEDLLSGLGIQFSAT